MSMSDNERQRSLRMIAALQSNPNDREANQWLMDACWPRAVKLAVKLLGDLELAQDVATEAVVKAHGELALLNDPAAFERWFNIIVRNTALDERKKTSGRTTATAEDRRKALKQLCYERDLSSLWELRGYTKAQRERFRELRDKLAAGYANQRTGGYILSETSFLQGGAEDGDDEAVGSFHDTVAVDRGGYMEAGDGCYRGYVNPKTCAGGEEVLSYATYPSPETTAIRDEQMDAVMRLVNGLAGDFKETIEAVLINGYTASDYAALVGLPSATIRARVRRFKEMAREKLRGDGHEYE
jgi:RNA polymerase sigma factor (sigma-70 family)